MIRSLARGAFSRLIEGLEPVHPVGDDVQQPLPGGHVVLVPGLDQFPGVPVRVGCRKTEGFGQPVLAVGAVVGQRLAGPFAGGQHAATGVAEVFAAVRLALARSGPQALLSVLRLDAVAQPVRAGR